MTTLGEIFAWIGKVLTWWIVVMPWEQAIRVRLGNRVKLLQAGFYFKIPFADIVYCQTTRLRMISIPIQTISTKDKQVISIAVSGGYHVIDMLLMFDTCQHPEMVVQNIIMSSVSEKVSTSDLADLSPSEIERYVRESISRGSEYGLGKFQFNVIGYAVVKTYRLISDQHYMRDESYIEMKK